MRIFLVLLGLLVSLQSPSFAQGYPSKNVTLVVPFAPAGASDIMARAIGQKLSEMWKQGVIIDNRPGASTTTGTAYVATQPADGYTLMLAPLPFVIMPHVYSNLRYKALEDFRAVAVIAAYPLVTVVPPSLPIHNLKDLFDYARAKPGIAYASVGPGTSPHLMSEYMAREEKLDMVHVPYRSGGQVMSDLVTGRIVFYSGPSTEILPQVQAGALRPIAVLTEKRTRSLPTGLPPSSRASASMLGALGPRSWCRRRPRKRSSTRSTPISPPCSTIRASAASSKNRARNS